MPELTAQRLKEIQDSYANSVGGFNRPVFQSAPEGSSIPSNPSLQQPLINRANPTGQMGGINPNFVSSGVNPLSDKGGGLLAASNNPSQTPAQGNGLSDQSFMNGGYDPGLMQKVGNFLPGLVGLKDIDYPYIRSEIRIENGVATLKENYSLDYKKGDEVGKKDAAVLGNVAVVRANQLLKENGMYGKSGLTMNFDVGMSSGRKGSKLGTGMFVGKGGSFKNGSTYTGLESMQDMGTQLDKYLSDTIGSHQRGGEIANVPQYAESNFMPAQGAGSFDNTNAMARFVLNAAAMAATGYGLSQLATAPAAGGVATAGTGGMATANTVLPTLMGQTAVGAAAGSVLPTLASGVTAATAAGAAGSGFANIAASMVSQGMTQTAAAALVKEIATKAPSLLSKVAGGAGTILDKVIATAGASLPQLLSGGVQSLISFVTDKGIRADSEDAANKFQEANQFKPYDVTNGVSSAIFDTENNTVNSFLSPEFQKESDRYGQLSGQTFGDLQGMSPEDFANKELGLSRRLAEPQNTRDTQRLDDTLFSRGMLGTTGGALKSGALADAQGQNDLRAQLAAMKNGRIEQGRLFNLYDSQVKSRTDLENSVNNNATLGANIGIRAATANAAGNQAVYDDNLLGVNKDEDFWTSIAEGAGNAVNSLFSNDTIGGQQQQPSSSGLSQSPFTQSLANPSYTTGQGWDASMENTFKDSPYEGLK